MGKVNCHGTIVGCLQNNRRLPTSYTDCYLIKLVEVRVKRLLFKFHFQVHRPAGCRRSLILELWWIRRVLLARKTSNWSEASFPNSLHNTTLAPTTHALVSCSTTSRPSILDSHRCRHEVKAWPTFKILQKN